MKFCYNTSFIFPNNPKDLDPSYKMDCWDGFGGRKTVSYNQRNTVSPNDIVFCLCPSVCLHFLTLEIFRLGFNNVKSLCNQFHPKFSSNEFKIVHRSYKPMEDVSMSF